jgi:hypothetical protein
MLLTQVLFTTLSCNCLLTARAVSRSHALKSSAAAAERAASSTVCMRYCTVLVIVRCGNCSPQLVCLTLSLVSFALTVRCIDISFYSNAAVPLPPAQQHRSTLSPTTAAIANGHSSSSNGHRSNGYSDSPAAVPSVRARPSAATASTASAATGSNSTAASSSVGVASRLKGWVRGSPQQQGTPKGGNATSTSSSSTGPTQAYLGEGNKFVYDAARQMWVLQVRSCRKVLAAQL